MRNLFPFVFQNDDALDVDQWNLNALALTEQLEELMERRYVRSTVRFPLDGVADTSDAAGRTMDIRVPASSDIILTVETVRLTVWGTDAKTVTVSSPDIDDFEGFTVTMAGASDDTQATVDAEKVTGLSATPFIQNDTNTPKTIVVEVESGGTITQGWLELSVVCDRAIQGASPSYDGHSPDLFAATDAMSATDADAEHTAFAASMDRLVNSTASRVEMYAIRNPASSTTHIWRIPAQAQTISHISAMRHRSAGATATSVVLKDEAGTTLDTLALADYDDGAIADTVPVNDLDDPNDDYTLELAPGVGNTIDMAWILVWYTE